MHHKKCKQVNQILFKVLWDSINNNIILHYRYYHFQKHVISRLVTYMSVIYIPIVSLFVYIYTEIVSSWKANFFNVYISSKTIKSFKALTRKIQGNLIKSKSMYRKDHFIGIDYVTISTSISALIWPWPRHWLCSSIYP